MGNHWCRCFPLRQVTEAKSFPLLRALPPDALSSILNFMTLTEIHNLVKLDPQTIGECVTLQHVAKNCVVDGGLDSLLQFLRRCGKDFHVPSNQRLIRILYEYHNTEKPGVLCDLCHTMGNTWFCWYWGLLKCNACCDSHEQHFEYEIESVPGTTHPLASKGCSGAHKYFVPWAKPTLAKFSPLLHTGRLATHGGCEIDDFGTMCVLAEPAFDPYTSEPCGPLITYEDIDEMDDCSSPETIDALLASLDVNEDRMRQLMCLADELEEKLLRIPLRLPRQSNFLLHDEIDEMSEISNISDVLL